MSDVMIRQPSTTVSSTPAHDDDDNDDNDDHYDVYDGSGYVNDMNTTTQPPPLFAQVTLYVGLVAFSIIIITLCFIASLATSSPGDPTRRYCRACCHRFLRLRDEPELPPEVTSSSSHTAQVDEPPSYEQALVMVRATSVSIVPMGNGNNGMLEEARLRCAAVDSPTVASTHHLIAASTGSDAAAGASLTSSASITAISSQPDSQVVNTSPPNYFEAVSGVSHVTVTPPPTYSELQRRILARLGRRKPPSPATHGVSDVTVTSAAGELSNERSVVLSPTSLTRL